LQEGMDWKDLSPKTFEVQIFWSSIVLS
jgi:hypothetical protein